MSDWIKSSPLNNGVEFLLLEINTALTFLELAKTTGNEETRQRNFANARHAYKTVWGLMQNAPLDDAQKTAIEEQLSVLKKTLEAAGQEL